MGKIHVQGRAMEEQMLRGPSESGDFIYGDSSAARKIAVGVVGAVCGAFEDHDFIRMATIVAWSLLHGYIYLEWKRHQP